MGVKGASSGLWTGAGLLAAIGSGLLLPQAAGMRSLIPWFLGVLLFASFLSSDLSSLRRVPRRALLLFPVLVWGLVPPLALLLGFGLTEDLAVGLFLIAVSPPALGMPVIVGIVGGDVATAVAVSVLYNLISPFGYAALSALWLGGVGVRVPVREMLAQTVVLVGVPYGLAWLVGRLPRLKGVLRAGASWYAPLALVLVVFSACASASARLRSVPTLEVMGVFGRVLGMCLAFYGVGYAAGRARGERLALSVATGQKNTALAVWLALASFGPLASVPAVLWIVSHHAVSAGMILAASRGGRG